MRAPFARLEERTDRAIFKHLANAVGLLDGEPVCGIFDAPAMEFEGVATVAPTVSVPNAAAATVELEHSQFVKGDLVDGTVYIVTGATPAGGDMTLLTLRKR
jgi:hypothetical protein